MVNLNYVGPPPAAGLDVLNQSQTTAIIAGATVNTATVNTDIASAVNATYVPYATVANLTTTYSPIPYYQGQDLLNLPLTAIGTIGANPHILGSTGYYGAASLDSAGHIPAAQFPALGSGYVKGPYGPSRTTTGSTSTVPMKIADWGTIGAAGMSFCPLVYMSVLVTGVMAKPVIEVYIANTVSTAPTSYAAAGTLVARGSARSLYSGLASVAVMPVPDTTSESYPTLLPPTYNIWLTAWVYDAMSYNAATLNSVSVQAGGIFSAAAYLMRGAT